MIKTDKREYSHSISFAKGNDPLIRVVTVVIKVEH